MIYKKDYLTFDDTIKILKEKGIEFETKFGYSNNFYSKSIMFEGEKRAWKIWDLLELEGTGIINFGDNKYGFTFYT